MLLLLLLLQSGNKPPLPLCPYSVHTVHIATVHYSAAQTLACEGFLCVQLAPTTDGAGLFLGHGSREASTRLLASLLLHYSGGWADWLATDE